MDERGQKEKDLLPHYILAKKFKGYPLQTILLFWNWSEGLIIDCSTTIACESTETPIAFVKDL
jgi:predicted regulator of amino acid metabolism with ACT domain